MPTKTEKRFKNSFDYKFEDVKLEKLSDEVVTQPNMTLSLKDLLTRFVRGGEVATFTPQYQNHDDFDENPDIMKMDAVEKLQYAKEIRERITETQAKLTAAAKQKPKPETEKKDEPKPETPPETQPPK